MDIYISITDKATGEVVAEIDALSVDTAVEKLYAWERAHGKDAVDNEYDCGCTSGQMAKGCPCTNKVNF